LNGIYLHHVDAKPRNCELLRLTGIGWRK